MFSLYKTILEPYEEYEDNAGPDFPVWVDDVRYTYEEYMQSYDEILGFEYNQAVYYSVGQDSDTQRYEEHLKLVKQILTGA